MEIRVQATMLLDFDYDEKDQAPIGDGMNRIATTSTEKPTACRCRTNTLSIPAIYNFDGTHLGFRFSTNALTPSFKLSPACNFGCQFFKA